MFNPEVGVVLEMGEVVSSNQGVVIVEASIGRICISFGVRLRIGTGNFLLFCLPRVHGSLLN